jgi:hypothetical protein
MTRLLLDNNRRPGRGGGSTEADTDEGPQGRTAASINDDTAGARLVRRHREDPSGRRSLTGIEFRRLRSI